MARPRVFAGACPSPPRTEGSGTRESELEEESRRGLEVVGQDASMIPAPDRHALAAA
jgi:hypothetical protein